MNITEKLIKLRKERNLTQEQLAEKLGLSISTIRNYENINRPRIPKNEILIQLANFYNVSTEYLLNDNIDNKSDENINIEKELGLSELAIKDIQGLKNSNLQNDFNDFLENVNITMLCRYINELKLLHEQWITNTCFMVRLYDFKDFLEKNIDKKPIPQNVINLFDIFNTKMLKFFKFIDTPDYICPFIDLSTCLSFRECLRSVEDSYISGNVDEFRIKLIEFTNMAHEISDKIKYGIDFNKYHIQNLIAEFLNTNFSDSYEMDSFYYRDLEDYYKFIDSESSFSNNILKDIKKADFTNYMYDSVLDTSKIRGEKNGSARTNKK